MRNKVIFVLLFWLTAVGTAFAQDDTPPTITAQPTAISLSASGEVVTISFAAEKSGSEISYQWYQSATDDNTAGSAISGATSAEYTTEPFTEKEIRYYYCTATADDGTSTTSNVAVVAHTGLPVLYVETPERVEITSKEIWTEGTKLTLKNAEEESWNFEDLSTSMRGRGNTTWSQKKKPYALKLDKKQEIMGMPKHKRWVLIANYLDNSYLKNHLAFYLSNQLEMDYTIRGKFIDLVFNGVYRGMYWFGEAIKVDKNRVNIYDGDDDMTDDDDKDYLIEMDVYYDEPVKFKTAIRQLPYMIKNDDYMIDEETSEITTGGTARLERLQERINELETLLYPDFVEGMNTNNCSAPDEAYANVIDVTSWAKFWLVNEIMHNGELGHPKSCYFTFESEKDIFKAGPVWDFDWSTLTTRTSVGLKNTIYYNALFKSPTFVAEVEKVWDKYSSYIDIEGEIERMRNILDVAAAVDRVRWGVHNDPTQTVSKGDFDDYVDFLKTEVEKKEGIVDSYITNTLPQISIYGAITITDGAAVLDGNYTGTEPTVLDHDIAVNSVNLDRTFNIGKTSTLVLPFSMEEGDYEGGSFYEFEGVDIVDGKWVAPTTPVSSIDANKPYIFVPSAETLTIKNGVTLKATTDAVVEDGEWTFIGLYDAKTWNSNDGFDYGFAGRDVEDDDVHIGDFVLLGTGASAKPFRCYLAYNDGSLSKSATEMPNSIEVRVNNTVASVEDPFDFNDGDDDFLTPTAEVIPGGGIKVWSYEKTIFIAASAGLDYQIYDISGRMLAHATTVSDRDEISIGRTAAGIAIVRIANQSYKIKY